MTNPTSRLLKITGALAAGTLLLGLTACGGESLADTDAPEKGGESTAAVEFTPVPDEEKAKSVIEGITPSETAAALLPEQYKTDGLKWTTSVGYPPMEKFDSTGENIIGIDPAFAHAISRTLGVSMTLEDQEFNSMIPGLLSGRYDVLASSMTDNAERRETTTFVDYVSAGNAFLVATGNPEGIATPADLCGKTIAVVDSGSSAALAEAFSAECEADGKAPYDILAFGGDQEANLAVGSGRAVATVTDYPVAEDHAANPDSNMDAVAIKGDESIWGLGIANEDQDLAKAVQAALQEMIDNGTYLELLKAWNVEGMAIDEATINGGE